MATWKLLLVVVPVFLALDFAWLGGAMRGFYSQELGDLARRQEDALAPRWGAALLVYLLIPGGLVLFVRPLLAGASPLSAWGWGAAFGLVVYGVYDLTNLAVLDKWTLRMTLADVAWGCTLCGAVSIVMRLLDRWYTAS